MKTITYFEMQKNYRTNLNKAQVISDLRNKKFDIPQFHWISEYNITRLITAIESVFESKDILNFLDFYLKPEHFNVVNVVFSKSQFTEDTQAIIEMKEFLKLCNIMVSPCKHDLSLLRRIVLVKQDYFDEYYGQYLRDANMNLTENQITILLNAKREESRMVWIDCPNLCFINNESYYLVNLSS